MHRLKLSLRYTLQKQLVLILIMLISVQVGTLSASAKEGFKIMSPNLVLLCILMSFFFVTMGRFQENFRFFKQQNLPQQKIYLTNVLAGVIMSAVFSLLIFLYQVLSNGTFLLTTFYTIFDSQTVPSYAQLAFQEWLFYFLAELCMCSLGLFIASLQWRFSLPIFLSILFGGPAVISMALTLNRPFLFTCVQLFSGVSLSQQAVKPLYPLISWGLVILFGFVASYFLTCKVSDA